MISEGFQIIAKDFGYELEFIVRDNDGNVMDITDTEEEAFSVRLKVRQRETDRIILDKACDEVTQPTLGKVKYTVQPNDFPSAGNYIGSLTLVYGTRKEISSAPFNMTVNKAV